MAETSNEIAVTGLTKRFGSFTAVDDVTFTARPGRVTAFLGPNGAGKTTTVRMLLGLTRPTSGAATIGGRTYGGLPDPTRTVGAVVEGAGFHPGRRAIDELRITAAAAGIPRSRCPEVLEQVGLGDVARRRVGAYSHGMRQRLALADALLGDPSVLVLDEPADGLDPEGITWIRRFLRWHADQGRTVFVSSHILAEVERLADDVLVIDRGRLVAQGPVETLLGGAGAATLARTPEPDRLVTLLSAQGHDATRDGDRVTVIAPTETVARVALDAGLLVTELRPVAADLETVFLQLTGGDARREADDDEAVGGHVSYPGSTRTEQP